MTHGKPPGGTERVKTFWEAMMDKNAATLALSVMRSKKGEKCRCIFHVVMLSYSSIPADDVRR